MALYLRVIRVSNASLDVVPPEVDTSVATAVEAALSAALAGPWTSCASPLWAWTALRHCVISSGDSPCAIVRIASVSVASWSKVAEEVEDDAAPFARGSRRAAPATARVPPGAARTARSFPGKRGHAPPWPTQRLREKRARPPSLPSFPSAAGSELRVCVDMRVEVPVWEGVPWTHELYDWCTSY